MEKIDNYPWTPIWDDSKVDKADVIDDNSILLVCGTQGTDKKLDRSASNSW